MPESNEHDLIGRLLPRIGQTAQDPELRFRAELALAFGLFEVFVTALACMTEFVWGTRALALVYGVGLLPILALLAWLRRGASPATVGTALVAASFALVSVTNFATGGQSIGANIALPTVAMFGVMMSSGRGGLAWLSLVVLEILVVAQLRRSNFEFPIQPEGSWVATAIDRVPLFFSIGSALIGWMALRAMERYRSNLLEAREAEHAARAMAARTAERFADFAEVAADGFWETDSDLRLDFVSPGFAQAMGLKVDEMLGLTPEQAYLRRFPQAHGLSDYMTPLRERKRFENQQLSTRDRAGNPHWLLNQGRPYHDANGEFAGFRGAVRDVTEQKHSELALADATRRLRLIADNLPAAIAHVDKQRRFTFNNRTHAMWLGYPDAELVGRQFEDVHAPEIYRQIAPHLEQALAGLRVSFEVDGGVHQYRATYVPERDADGEVVGVFGLIDDITRIKQVENELRTLAQFDVLTGLANRRRFNERLTDAVARSERTGQPMALMFLDLDRFKRINDRRGHKAGDLVLQEFARRLSGCVRRTDTAARLAGDEFVVILEPLSSIVDAETVALKIMQAMHEPIAIEGESVQVTVSIGIAPRRLGETDGEALLRRADEALYAVKAERRGQFRVAE